MYLIFLFRFFIKRETQETKIEEDLTDVLLDVRRDTADIKANLQGYQEGLQDLGNGSLFMNLALENESLKKDLAIMSSK
jgi:uncharacterized protein Smg (DUF494 family)